MVINFKRLVLAMIERKGNNHKPPCRMSGKEVFFDAMGLAAVRFDVQGQLNALAAGGLKFFRTKNFKIEFLGIWISKIERLNNGC